ncbi:DUF6777 domain-containing protein [Streptomyces longwoodensis]|uniref:DUF6777 domain-containing protein n=1 Tax=Streptomyces longwoodensis TaxID=68231 RepID=UPI0033E56F56
MSAEPPFSGRPTGPPSGPLSGPSQPPSGPPSQPPGGAPGGDTGGTPPHRPWWRSAPRIAVLTAVVVAAVAVALVLGRSGGGSGSAGGEVFLQAAGKTGPDPFTESTAKDNSAPPVSVPPTAATAPTNEVRGVDGGSAGLYGGTRHLSACDVEKQIRSLGADATKNEAFASVAGVTPSGVPGYLRGLTPVQLRMDTRVTNHGYRDGAATSYQAVLQAGTAVLVDARGLPRVRCACGNPLTQPVPQRTTPKPTGDSWPTYSPANVVVVTPAPKAVDVFVLYDPEHRGWIARPRGDTGRHDRPAPPPTHPSPPVTISPSGKSSGPSSSSSSPSDRGSTSPGASSSSPSSKPAEPPSPPKPPPPPDSSSSEPEKPGDSSVSPPPKPPSGGGSAPQSPPEAPVSPAAPGSSAEPPPAS